MYQNPCRSGSSMVIRYGWTIAQMRPASAVSGPSAETAVCRQECLVLACARWRTSSAFIPHLSRLIVRRGVQRPVRVRSSLAGQEAEEIPGADCEEDDRLLERHRRPSDLLIRQRRKAPEPVRHLDVVVVDGTRDEREQEPERAHHDECREQIDRTCACRDAVRLVLEHRPPEEEPG